MCRSFFHNLRKVQKQFVRNGCSLFDYDCVDSRNEDMMVTTRFLNIEILSVRKQNLLKSLKQGVVYTPNVDHLVRLQKEKDFYEAYQQADWVLCDSVILCRLSRLLKHNIVESIPGATLFRDFCDYHCDDEGCRIFILGGKEGIAKRAQNNINARIGRNIVVGSHSPSFHFVDDKQESLELVRMVKESGATVLIVCATSPKQEVWIARYRRMLQEVRLFMALGATVDFEAEAVKRCPLKIQRLGMEWFWRFCLEPKRLFRRYFWDDMKIFIFFPAQLLGLYKNPFREN